MRSLMLVDVLILSLVVFYCLLAIRKLIRDKKKGVCTGCSAKSCAGCHGCDQSYIDDLLRKAERKA